MAETLHCKIECARKLLKSYVIYCYNLQARNRRVAKRCRRWKTWAPATHSERACTEIRFSHGRGCKCQKRNAHRRRWAQKKLNGTEGENAISEFWNTPWTRSAIWTENALSPWQRIHLLWFFFMHGNEQRHRAWVRKQYVLRRSNLMEIKRFMREGFKKLK